MRKVILNMTEQEESANSFNIQPAKETPRKCFYFDTQKY